LSSDQARVTQTAQVMNHERRFQVDRRGQRRRRLFAVSQKQQQVQPMFVRHGPQHLRSLLESRSRSHFHGRKLAVRRVRRSAATRARSRERGQITVAGSVMAAPAVTFERLEAFRPIVPLSVPKAVRRAVERGGLEADEAGDMMTTALTPSSPPPPLT
jgi:hypothetical protein